MKRLLALSLLAALPAFAENIQIKYTGTVSGLTYADCLTLSNGSCTSWAFTTISTSDFVGGNIISVGGTFAGSLVYDAAAPLTGISSDGFQAVHLNAVPDATFQSGGVSLPSAILPMAGRGSFSVVNDRSGYDAFFVQQMFSRDDLFASLSLFMMDSTGKVFDSFAVPRSLDFAAFSSSSLSVGFLRRSDGDQVQMTGKITSVEFLQPVPEPASMALFLMGLLAVCGISRKKAK